MIRYHRAGSLTRRQVLAWGSGTALGLVLAQGGFAAEEVSLDEFMALSERLLGGGASPSDQYGADYLQHLLDEGLGADLAALAKGGSDSTLESRIIGQWYTGLAADDTVVTYTDALMWEALDYTKPMGWCGGETGYWADAPEGEA
ncbi:Membrane bound FAD containing D-sorbitol dehydrogenase [Devosia equisanguinis]|uniref:Membrane bound FAD containing D-sorbitol dehydrogenase n=1 Tax=Devosia equisanguinis TaxID=2490941 RepID=A0A3S4CQA7_9HYPH|nr:sugar dehydrogenase complex small subunit [Devosia equisanguinis]VDS03554.1 Membrane bound FAD containing D-sorbitol dehydrogenase [Devosia equisanguinis]